MLVSFGCSGAAPNPIWFTTVQRVVQASQSYRAAKADGLGIVLHTTEFSSSCVGRRKEMCTGRAAAPSLELPIVKFGDRFTQHDRWIAVTQRALLEIISQQFLQSALLPESNAVRDIVHIFFPVFCALRWRRGTNCQRSPPGGIRVMRTHLVTRSAARSGVAHGDLRSAQCCRPGYRTSHRRGKRTPGIPRTLAVPSE